MAAVVVVTGIEDSEPDVIDSQCLLPSLLPNNCRISFG
jgi:hypothetical protein